MPRGPQQLKTCPRQHRQKTCHKQSSQRQQPCKQRQQQRANVANHRRLHIGDVHARGQSKTTHRQKEPRLTQHTAQQRQAQHAKQARPHPQHQPHHAQKEQRQKRLNQHLPRLLKIAVVAVHVLLLVRTCQHHGLGNVKTQNKIHHQLERRPPRPSLATPQVVATQQRHHRRRHGHPQWQLTLAQMPQRQHHQQRQKAHHERDQTPIGVRSKP